MHFANIRENERNVNFKFAIRMQRKMTIITTQLQVLQNSLSHRYINFFLVFELLEKGELLEVPTEKPLTEDEAWRCFRDVISGLEYCKYKSLADSNSKQILCQTSCCCFYN